MNTGEETEDLALSNGLHLTITDLTVPIAGDLYSVHLQVESSIPIRPEYMGVVPENLAQAFQRDCNGMVAYRRDLKRQGVLRKDLARVKTELLGSFQQNSLPYLSDPSFPEKFVRQRLAEWMKKRS